MSKFKVGQVVSVNFGKGQIYSGVVARCEYAVAGFIYYVDVDGVGCKRVNEPMLESEPVCVECDGLGCYECQLDLCDFE